MSALLLAWLTSAVALTGAVIAPAHAELPDGADPLAVTIDRLTPGQIPRSGNITISGTITNRDDQPWTTLNVYPYRSLTPMTTAAEVAGSLSVDTHQEIGARVTDPGPYQTIDELDPGQTTTYSITVPRSRLGLTEQGVYWFGVHVLAQRDAPRDGIADGRALTLMPLVDTGRRVPDRQPVSVVVPLRSQVTYAPDGSLADPEGFAELLGSGGRLGALVDLGLQAARRGKAAHLTWLVDPAVVDAAARLAAGNPPRSIAPTIDPDATSGSSASPDPTENPTDDSTDDSTDEPTSPASTLTASGQASAGSDDASPSGETSSTSPVPNPPDSVDPSSLDPTLEAAADRAASFLADLSRVLESGGQVLALPYGDVDLAAAAEYDDEAYPRARRRSGDTLGSLGIATSPGLATPSGFLDLAGIDAAEPDETLLLTDRAIRGGAAAAVVRTVDGHRVVTTSGGTSEGGPGAQPLSTLSLRQRILSDAAVRALAGEQGRPLVVVLPKWWTPDDPAALLSQLRTAWTRVATVGKATDGLAATPVRGDLRYPGWERDAELPASSFATSAQLVDTGDTLQQVLTLNDQVGSLVSAQAFTGVSYADRRNPAVASRALIGATSYLTTLLGRITVSTPPGVTLSSASGGLPATIVNHLDQPVTVALDVHSTPPMKVRVPQSVEVEPDGQVSVLLEATTEQEGLHNVTISLTDRNGAAIGSEASLPIRAAEVSNVIWLVIGSGAGLLLVAIVVRVVRRIRGERPGSQRTSGPAELAEPTS
ncbi:hypothetical protein ISG29_19830 [Nocardioides sp. CBS4Y-1]|uniref:Secreted protein n=1 Tax=Nocardioides acrostichi TaxID=2784339 RepID=A0A930YCW4_9ACTN|nr:hypothetical protein [Nocardioides acrostichi]